MKPPPGFDNKSVIELLPLLDSSVAQVRINATAGISWQLEQEEYTLTNIQPAVAMETLEKTKLLLKHDKDSTVRIGCAAVLVQLDAWTNTSSALVEAVDDQDYLVRVRAITGLLQLDKERGLRLPARAIFSLEQCLDSKLDHEVLWQAAFAAGESGDVKFLPLLKVLSTNSDAKIKEYADDAIKKLIH